MCSRLLGWPMLALLLGAVASPVHGQAVEPTPEVELRPGDALRVVVKDEPALGGEFPVDLEGSVMLPLVGRVRVVDRPFALVRAELEAAYVAEVSEPVVQLVPLLRVSVLGEVRQPGLFVVDPTHTFADVLALAGGPTPAADRNRIELVRGGRLESLRLEPGADGVAIPLRSGDQVFVGRRNWFRDNTGLLVGATASIITAAVTSLILR